MTKAETVILAGFFFALYMSFFGISVAATPTVGSAMATILAGPPAGILNPPKCGAGDIACATYAIAVSLGNIVTYPATLLVWGISKVTAFFGFISIAILGPQQGANATPILGFFWAALMIYVLFELIRIFRGNSTAGV